MIIGGIYKWATQRARGHQSREKYHIFISETSSSRNVFLFVNSINYYDEGFELKNNDYPCFPKASSFIGCTSVVIYNNSEISHLSDNDCLAVLSDTHKQALANHISQSEVMEQRHINLIFSSLLN